MAADTKRLRTVAQYQLGIDLPARLAFAQDVVRQQADAILEAADEIDSLRSMVVALTQELEHCKASSVEA